jgi:hypothetical protein
LLFSSPLLADDLFLDNESLPQVLTATRLKQSPAAVPGSMTVIDSELINASGARDISELLRLVPGMMVGNISGNQAAVNYHGTNATEARRMQVLIDGRSVYRAGLATVDWSDIPVAMEDIERIEVFRGPNTVSYGANALMAVVNIITRNPADSHGTRMKVTRGQRGIDDFYASQGVGWDGGDLRLSLSGQQDDGFDTDSNGADYRDSRRLNRFNLAVSQTLSENQSIDWQLNAKDGTNQRPYTYRPVFSGITAAGNNSDVVAKDYAGSLRWNLDINPDHSLYIQGSAQHWDRQQTWRACDAEVSFSPQLTELWQLNPNYTERLARNIERFTGPGAPAGTAAEQALGNQVLAQWRNGARQTLCGDIDQSARETRYDLELQDTLSLSDSLRLVSGMNYRYDRANSNARRHHLARIRPTRVARHRALVAAGRRHVRRHAIDRQLADPAGSGQLPDQPASRLARGVLGSHPLTGHVREQRQLELPGDQPAAQCLRPDQRPVFRQDPRPRRPRTRTHALARAGLQRLLRGAWADGRCETVLRRNQRHDQRTPAQQSVHRQQFQQLALQGHGNPAGLAPEQRRPAAPDLRLRRRRGEQSAG